MRTHTPGPWSVVDGFYPGFREIKGPSFDISIVMRAHDITFEKSMLRKADAQLIAAAPELFDVAKLIEPLIPAIIAMGHLTAEQTDSIRAAIVKATERSA